MTSPSRQLHKLLLRTSLAPLAGLTWATLAFLFRAEFYDDVSVFASTALLIAALLFYQWKPSDDRAPFRLLGFFVCGQAFLSSGIGVILPIDPDTLYSRPTVESFSFAVSSTVVFSFMYLAGVWITAPRSASFRPLPSGPDSGPTRFVAYILAAAGALTLVSVSLLKLRSLGSLPRVLFNPGLLAPFFVAAHLLGGRVGRGPAWIIALAQGLNMFISSMLSSFLFTLRDMVLAVVHLRRPLPIAPIVFGLAMIVVLNPAKHIFRHALAEGPAEDRTSTTVERAAVLWEEALETTWSTSKPVPREQAGFESTAQRFNYNSVSAHVFSVVPSRLPFENGGTYEDIPLSLVPRVLYPDKPQSEQYTRARWFIKLGIQNQETVETTALALPASTEAYWNFGWPGVFLVPMLVGSLTGIVLRFSPRDPAARVGFCVLLATSLGQFLDMMVWVVPQFIAVAVSGVFASVACDIGRATFWNRWFPPHRRFHRPNRLKTESR